MEDAGKASLREALAAWDGTAAHAGQLRAAVADSPAPRGKPQPDERGLAKLRAAYSKKTSGLSLVDWLVANPEQLALVAPLVGDPALAPWPWSDPLTLDDGHARAALALLARVPVPVDDDIRAFLRVFLRVRKRDLWILAARAMAAQAPTDPELRSHVEGLWAAAFPSGPVLDGTDTRTRRHVLFLGACAHRAGIPLDISGLAGLRPADDADRSVVALALCELGDATASKLLDDPLPPQTTRALIAAKDALPEAARDVLRDRLRTARWIDEDGLLAWLEAVRVLGLEPDDPETAGARGVPGEGTALDLVQRLQEVFDPGLGPLCPPRLRAVRIAEALALLERPEVADLPWPRIAAAVGPTLPSAPGPAGEVGPAMIGAMSALAGWPVQHLLRHGDLELDGILALAPLENGFVSNQVAMHIERVLRAAPDDRSRVRALWQLMVVDPPSRTFETLAGLVRADAAPGEAGSGPLVRLVQALCGLDHLRDRGAGFAELAGAMRDVSTAVGDLVGDAACPLEPLADLLATAADPPPLEEAVRTLTALLSPGTGSLPAWSAWLEGDSSADRAQREEAGARAVARLDRAVQDVTSARPRVETLHAFAVREAVRELRTVVEGLGWPERYALEALLTGTLASTERELEVGHRALDLSRTLDGHLQRGEEQALLALLTRPEVPALMAPADLRRAHRFLLQQLLFRDATALRLRVADRVALPSSTGQLLPIFAAVAGGAFLVLDFGSAWLEAAEQGLGPRIAATTLLTLALAYTILVTTLGTNIVAGAHSTRWGLASIRVLPVYLAALAVAVGSTVLVLATLGEPFHTLPVFAGLSLFFGIFVGLVLQGRPVLDVRDGGSA